MKPSHSKAARGGGLRPALLLSLVALFALPAFEASAADLCQVSSFGTPTTFNARATRALVVADLNGDGRPDVAAANEFGGTVSVLLGNGAGGFGPAATFTAQSNPISIASADFNGDGKTDLVTGHETRLTVLFGDGAGAFRTTRNINLSFSGFGGIGWVAVADFNADGRADIAAATSAGLSLSLGNGDATFTTKFFQIGQPATLGPVVVADFNKDGKADVAALKPSSNAAVVLLGDGAGNLGAFTDFALGATPNALVAADFNGDGTPDLAATAVEQPSNGGVVSVILGDGAGGFGAATKFANGGGRPTSIAAADFNGDAKQDLAVTNSEPHTVFILQGDGAGAFAPSANFTTGGTFPSAVAASDLNGDGEPDLVVGNNLTQTIAVLLNSCGAPTTSTAQFNFNAFSAFEGEPSAVISVIRTGSVQGAASVDFATSDGTAGPSDYTPASGTLSFADGEASKTFTFAITNDNIHEGLETVNLTLSNATGAAALGTPSTATLFIASEDPAPSIAVGDASVAEGNAGTTDMVFTVTLSNPSSSNVTVNYATADGAALAEEDYAPASGTLTFAPGETSKNLVVKVNGDTLEEVNESFSLNLSGPSNGTLADALGLGTILDDDASCPAPSFGAGVNFTVGTNPLPVVAADFNNDGRPDLAVGNIGAGTVSVLLGNGAGSFGAAVNSASGATPRSLAAADFNGDGKLDLAVTGSEFGTQVAILLGDGAGGFAAPANFAVGNSPRAVAAADFNGDGRADLAVVNIASANVSVLLGDGAGGFGPAANLAVGTSPFAVLAADFNKDGRPDLAVTNQNSNSVSLLVNNGSGSFAAAVNFAVGSNPQWAAAADLNLDGRLDLAVANITSGDVSILLGDGAGGFGAATSVAVGGRPFHVIAADFNGDARPDLAVSRAASGSETVQGVSVLFGNGSGGFGVPSTHLPGGGSLGLASADFNADSKPDLAATNFQSNTVSLLTNGCSFATSLPRLQFSSPNYRAAETAGSALITVLRSGDASAPAEVEYTTSDGTATARGDYTAAIGRLRFAAGETSKTFTVFITDDAHVEGPETVTLTLSNASGAAAGVPSTATLTVNSEDVLEPAPNPADSTQFFVRQHYVDFFNREPDAPGLAFWTNVIDSCGADAQCREVNRINVSGAFFLSIEFKETGYLVERLYKAAFGDATGTSTLGGTAHTLSVPVVRLEEFLPDTQRIGRGVVVNQGDWKAQIEANKVSFTQEFVQRPRFLEAFPLSLSSAEFVDRLNGRAGGPLDASERQALIDELTANNTTAGRASALRKVAEDPTLEQAEINRAFVLMQYFGYLRRNPNDAPDSDYTGYEFWLGNLERFNGNFVQAELVKAFISSTEYRQRFGRP